jgi:hypothetical protein
VEVGIDPEARRSRSIDVQLERAARREIAVVELVDLIADAGQDMRGLSDKAAAVRRTRPGYRVAGLLAVRATRRNRTLVTELAPLIDARFPASSSGLARRPSPRSTDRCRPRTGSSGPGSTGQACSHDVESADDASSAGDAR